MKDEVNELNDWLQRFGGPVHPVYFEMYDQDGTQVTTTHTGMSVRDYFAGQALAGMLALPGGRPPGEPFEEYQRRIAENCYSFAEAMLAERAKR